MPQGSKAKYSSAQKKKAEHIEESYERKGTSPKKAAAIAWATVNKESGGGEAGGSGHKSASAKSSARKDTAHNAANTRKANEKPGSLEDQSKAELLVKAREKNISGRSTMNKQDLILALRRSAR